MIRRAFISGGVVYHQGLIQAGGLLDEFDIINIADLARHNLNAYDIVVVPRSTDGDALWSRRYQFSRFLDTGGVLIAFGEMWSNWFPGCYWGEECAEDTHEPVIASQHPIVSGFTPSDLHWHPARDRWCCHGHLIAPDGAEILVRNQRGDPWTYIDRETTNGVIFASTNLDPDTHTYHGSEISREFFERLLTWAYDEAEQRTLGRQRRSRKIAGLYSGVHFQRAYYTDPEFGSHYSMLPVSELAATDLHDYATLWIPRESNQNILLANRGKLNQYLDEGGTIVSFEQVNQDWLPAGSWELRPVNMDSIRLAHHPLVDRLTTEQVSWHSHGAYDDYPNAEVLIDDGQGNVMLYLDERSFQGTLLAGTIDPDCHAGFGTETTRPLLRSILSWMQSHNMAEAVAL